MEILHAYPAARLGKANSQSYTSGNGTVNIRGTRMTYSASASRNLSASVANGLQLIANAENAYIDFTDGVDATRTESYWVTVGWKWTSVNATNRNEYMILVGAQNIGTPAAIFGLAGASVAYVEVAINPITKEIRVYVNGNRLAGTWTYDGSGYYVSCHRTIGINYSYYVADVVIARYEGNEEPRLRRWRMESLAPVTNNIGAAIDVTDGTTATVNAAELVATYNIPANTLALVVEASAISPDNASDLTTRISDTTTTVNKRINGLGPTLPIITGTVPWGFGGNAVIVGTIKPAANATTLTVGVKAVDRT